MIANHSEGCYICGSWENLDVHHVIPRKHGGALIKGNTVLLCRKCHKDIERGNSYNIHEVAARCAMRAVEVLHKRLKKEGLDLGE